MGELQDPLSPSPPPPPPSADNSRSPPPALSDDASPPKPRFDPSRMIGIIRRKAMIKELAGLYHAECLAYCQEILQLQNKLNEEKAVHANLSKYQKPYNGMRTQEDSSRKEAKRPPKRLKKSR